MARQKEEKKSIRKLTKLAGRSFGITLPIEWVRELGWKEHQKLSLSLNRKYITLKDWKKKKGS